MHLPQAVFDKLKKFDQAHLVRWWDQLLPDARAALLQQIQEIDFPLNQRLATAAHLDTGNSGERAKLAQPPQQLERLPVSGTDQARWEQARRTGQELLNAGKVGAILVAGGQGSRLGFLAPKGMFPIGPVSQRTLFHWHCEQLLARSQRAGKPIPYFVMTSDATHSDTIDFFHNQNYFGLPRSDVYFFSQASLPVVEAHGTRILLEGKGEICLSPDGHGGLLKALEQQRLLDEMQARGIEHLYYHQIDNPTAIVCDPILLGLHAQHASDVTTKVVAKVSAEEKMGVVVDLSGKTEIIEYSDLPAERAQARADDGSLLLWAGSTAMHVFRRGFLKQLVEEGVELPYHVAHRAATQLNDAGEIVTPETANSRKFEQFIFDVLPQTSQSLVVEADRRREFNPVKNKTGSDTPASTRAALSRIARDWLRAAGAEVSETAVIELSPLHALEPGDLHHHQLLPPGTRIEQDVIWGK